MSKIIPPIFFLVLSRKSSIIRLLLLLLFINAESAKIVLSRLSSETQKYIVKMLVARNAVV